MYCNTLQYARPEHTPPPTCSAVIKGAILPLNHIGGTTFCDKMLISFSGVPFVKESQLYNPET